MLTNLEKVTGVRQMTCPWQALRDPFVIAVLHGHRLFKERQLFDRMPRCPEALMRGIEVYDGALNAVQNHDLRIQQEQAEQRNRELEEQMRNGGGVKLGSPKWSR